MTGIARTAGPLLAQVLTWCAEHPWNGDDLPYDDITFQRNYDADGSYTVSILGDVPDVLAVTTDLLDAADPDLMSFERGLLVLNIQPEKLLYWPLYVACRAESVVFRRTCPRCYNSRKVPDFSQGLDPVYGEPRPKPCPVCEGWPR